jgi:hypothetical protein
MTTTIDFKPKGQANGDRITAAISKIPGLSSKQRQDVRAAFVSLMNDQAK